MRVAGGVDVAFAVAAGRLAVEDGVLLQREHCKLVDLLTLIVQFFVLAAFF